MNIPELNLEPFNFEYNQLDKNDFLRWNNDIFNFGFPYEYYYFKGNDLYRPWEDFSVIREQLTNEWAEIVRQLEIMFANREKQEIKPYLLKGIVLYVSFMYWSNQVPVNLCGFPACLKELKGKPVNVEERLPFILARPYFYPSFMQLKSLMEEQIKIAAKMAALNKYTK